MPATLLASSSGVDSATIDSTGANLLIGVVISAPYSGPFTDNRGNTWVATTEATDSGFYARTTIVYCLNPSSVGASHTIQANTHDIADPLVMFAAFALSGGTYAFHSEDQNAEVGAYNATFGDVGPVTPPGDGALILLATGVYGASTSGFSVSSPSMTEALESAGTSQPSGQLAYLNQSTAAAVTPTVSWTGDARWANSIVVFALTATGDAELEGDASVTAIATGSLSVGKSLAASAVAQSTATGNLSVTHYGILTTPPLKNNAGTVLASETGVTVHIYSMAGGLIVTKTGQVTDASGVLAVTDPALVAAVEYRGVVVLASGASGLFKLTSA